jgi:hypothetical protein
MFAGPSGSGKSTLATALIADGYDYLSDDLSAVSAADGRVWPFPLGINLKRGSRDIVSIPDRFEIVESEDATRRDRILVPPPEAWSGQPADLRAVVFPRYREAGGAIFERLAPFDAFSRLLADRVHLPTPLSRARITRFLSWLKAIPCYALTFGDLGAAKAIAEKLAL